MNLSAPGAFCSERLLITDSVFKIKDKCRPNQIASSGVSLADCEFQGTGPFHPVIKCVDIELFTYLYYPFNVQGICFHF